MKKFRSIILIAFILLFIGRDLFSQENVENQIKRNSVYTELFGSAVYYFNLNYDRLFYVKEKSKVSGGMGATYWQEIISITPQFNYLYGNIHHFETGIGMACFFDTYKHSSGFDWALPFRIGYRYQKASGGLFLKVAFTPTYIPNLIRLEPESLIENNRFSKDDFIDLDIVPSGGVAFGWTF